MSAEIINLNKYRKAANKDAGQKKAAENRRKHGRTKDEIRIHTREEKASKKQLDNKKLIPDSDADDCDTPA